jgi:beta-glucanase (GH16 family)
MLSLVYAWLLSLVGAWPRGSSRPRPGGKKRRAGRFRGGAEELEPRVALNAPGAGWDLLFDDEFSGTGLDTSKWSAASPGWTMPNSLSTASASKVSVANGLLTLTATRTGSSGATQFSSGSISTYNKFTFTGGYAEARIKLPGTPGSWPAFWGLYNGWPPEADVMEYPLTTNGTSGLQNNQYNTNYHYTDSGGHPAAGAGPVTTSYDLRGNWHTFGMKWVPGASMTFYLDDRQVQSYTGSTVSQMRNMYLILDFAAGGWPGTPGTTQWPVGVSDQMQVDYVRVYGYTATSSPAIANPGFNTTGSWALSGGASVINGATIGYTGTGDLHVSGVGEAHQTITGLSPNTTYALSGMAVVANGNTAGALGVRNFSGGAGDVSVPAGDPSHVGSWVRSSVTFTTGPADTSAVIYCKNANTNAVYFDDLDLVQATTASPLPDLTTNVGTPTGTVPFTLTGTAARFAAVSAVCSNPSLVPNGNLSFGGGGTQRTLAVAPAPGQVGTATITVTVTEPIWGGRTTRGFVVNVVNPALPAPWWNLDVGTVGYSGSASTDGFTYTVTGSGADVWNQSDGFQYAYQPVTGDGTIIARVASQGNTGGYAKAGVMIRESWDPGSRHALVDLTPSHGTEFIRRTATGANAVSNFHTGAAVPYWVRLDRGGDTLTAYDSADGVNWNLVGSATVPMAPAVYAGLAVCAFNNAALNTSTFDNVYLSWAQVSVDLSSSFNQVGGVTDGTPFSGGLDGNGNAYSASLLGPAVMANGSLFALGAPGTNAVQAAGQAIALPAGQFSTLTFVGTGVNGPQPGQTFTVNYADGSSDTFTQDLSDWQNPQGYAGESVVASLAYLDAADGSSWNVPNYLYQYSFTLNNQKAVSGITLPGNGNVLLLAMNLLL